MSTATSASRIGGESTESGLVRLAIGTPSNESFSTSSSSPSVVVSGILFSRSVRSSFASFTLAPISWSSSSPLSTTTAPSTTEKTKIAATEDDLDQSLVPLQQSPILVRLQFMDSIKELRSFCRKQYKLGDQIDFLYTQHGRWEQSPLSSSIAAVGSVLENPLHKTSDIRDGSREDTALEETIESSQEATTTTTSWSQQPRWVVDLSSTSEAEITVVMRNSRVWSMKECQHYQLKYIAPQKQPKRKQEPTSTKTQKRANHRIENNKISAWRSDDGESRRAIVDNANTTASNNNSNDDSGNNHHGGGKEKRLQAQELIAFFVNLIGSKVVLSNETEQGTFQKIKSATPTTTPTLEQRMKHDERIRSWFNRGDGVLDVAGGCGHVSMALGIQGISSTVVDARASVGKLPKRDRKIWKRSLQSKPPRIQRGDDNHREGQTTDISTTADAIANSSSITTPINAQRQPTPAKNNYLSEYDYCQPVLPPPKAVPFQSQQAWFGSKPIGYDASFRHPDEENIPVLMATSIPKNASNNTGKIKNADNHFTKGEHAVEDDGRRKNDDTVPVGSNRSDDLAVLKRSVSALVALHPDEATGEIVEQAVKHRIPFVVVPCCVFARLFPHRNTFDGRPVSSYEDLLDFLQEQDPSIQRTRLSFGGKNVALWSVFPDG